MPSLRPTLVSTFLYCGLVFGTPALPVHFEPAATPGTFLARGLHYRIEFTGNRATFHGKSATMGLTFDGASPHAAIEPSGELRAKSTIFHGSDPSKWRGEVPGFRQLRVTHLYPGIGLTYYGTGDELEYDLTLQPGANPAAIRLRFSGSAPKLDAQGNLSGEFLQKRPVAYQLAANGARVAVESRYRSNRDGSFGFALGAYDRKRELVIDPTLSFSAYVAGSGQDSARAIGHDAQGYIYVAGNTTSSDLTLSGDSQQTATGGGSDIFIAVFDPTISDPTAQLLYATYFGGSGDETVNSMVVSPSGTVYLVGTTSSADLPLQNPAQSTAGGGYDAFVLKVIPKQGSGGFYYASYLGGTGDEAGYGIAITAEGKLCIAGSTKSTDLPLAGAIESSLGGPQDGFVAIFDPTGSGSNTLAYSTYLGGTGVDIARDVAVAADGTLWVVGNTFSADFPVAGNAFTPSYSPGGDAFISQLNPGYSGWPGLLYSTFFGGTGADQANKVLIDSKGRIIVAGNTTSDNSQYFPLTANAIQTIYGGGGDAFLSILDPTIGNAANQVVYSTYFGGRLAEVVDDLKQDSNGVLYLSGFTLSPNLPVTQNALQSVYDLNLDAYLLKLDPSITGSGGILYSSYVGSKGNQTGYGVDFDTNGNLYLVGSTTSSIFDPFGGVAKPTDPGHTNAFVLGVTPCPFSVSPQTFQFANSGGSATFNVSTSPGCGFSARSALDWATVSPASGTGSGSVQVTVLANGTGAQRQGNISIGGISVTLGQDQ